MAVSKKQEVLQVPSPNFGMVMFTIKGTAPYVQNKFSSDTKAGMQTAMEAGDKKKARTKKEPKDFHKSFQDAQHVSTDGWVGIPAAAFRSSLISACRAANIVMTRAKLAVFIEPDGFDKTEGSALVRIKGEPEEHYSHVRIGMGTTSIVCRPMWREWEADITIRHDADMIGRTDVANLLTRAGLQVGIGEGRPDSKSSVGQGWGTFIVKQNGGD